MEGPAYTYLVTLDTVQVEFYHLFTSLQSFFPSLPTLVHTSSLLLDLCDGQLFTSVKFQGACTCPNFTPEVCHASEL